MGNRAVLMAHNNTNKSVYLHWNGGRDSVEAFLKYCELRGFRGFEKDYGMARFCQVVGNFFGGNGLSVGIMDGAYSHGDNGIYVIKGWEIVDRVKEDYYGFEQDKHDLQKMLIAIDNAQPINQQLGEYLTSSEVPTSDLKIDDEVYVKNAINGKVEKYHVVGFGKDEYINGTNVHNLPYVDNFLDNKGNYEGNINNYITDEFVRLKEKSIK